MHKTITLFTLGLGAIAAACSGDDDIDLHTGEKLENGETPPCEVLDSEQLHGIGWIARFPNVLGISTCTAVLIGPRTFLSAAHCLEFTTQSDAQGFANFEIDPGNHCGKKRVVAVQSWVSFSTSANDLRALDLVVGFLSEPILEGNGIRYFSIANGPPQPGSIVTLYGRGAVDDPWQDYWWMHSLRRAKVVYDYGLNGADWLEHNWRSVPIGEDHLRPGDSGGPALTATGAIFGIHSGGGDEDGDGTHDEVFANPVFLKRRTALPSVLNAYAAGQNWPRPVGQNGWPCADGQLTFCDADDPDYVRECAGPNDLWAAKRRPCPGGCENGACKPTPCDGLAVDACLDAGCYHTGTYCKDTWVEACLPEGFTDLCGHLDGETHGPAPTPGGNPTSGGCCAGDNLCANPPSTPGCAMTFPGGYCDPNGDGSYEDANWEKGYNQFQKQCTSPSNPPGDPPSNPNGCPCSGDNRCANPPSTPGCPMTFPGGYCDPNGDASFTDADWVKGFEQHAAECG